MNRNQLLQIRPVIPTIMEAQASSLAEQFQNRTLRPLLKFQNELLVAIFRKYIARRKDVFNQLSKSKQRVYIEESIRKDQKFKHLLLGTIIGQFTTEEWEQYLEVEKELNRRMADMIIQRLQDQLIGA